MSVDIALVCDGDDCYEVDSFGAASIPTTNKRAQAAGWTVHDDQGHDYCPKCTSLRKTGVA